MKKPLIQISHFKERPWQKQDHVCVMRKNTEIACGYIYDTNPDHAIIRVTHQPRVITRRQLKEEGKSDFELEFKSFWPAKGDEVHLISHNPRPAIETLARELTSKNEFGGSVIPSQQDIVDKEKIKHQAKSILVGGIDWAFPHIHYQQALTEKFATGLKGIYLDHGVENGGLKGLGGLLSFNYYPAKAFEGLWLQAGLGAYKLSTYSGTTTVSTWSMTSTATVGYRLVYQEQLTFGLGGGIQYLPNAKPSELNLQFSGIVPSFILDFGITF